MRYMITDCAEVPQAAYEPEAEFDVNAIPGDDAPDVEPAEEAAAGEASEASADETSEATSDDSEENN